MRKIKEALRLRWECGLSESAVGEACHCGRTTVQDYLKRARVAGLGWEQIRDMDDADLERRLFPVQQGGGSRRPEPAWGDVARELRRKGMTLELLWEEYRGTEPEGYSYSQFCERFRRYRKAIDVTMRQVHIAGDKLFVDYSGQTVEVVDAGTGEMRKAEIFVAVFGATNYTYAEATWTQGLADWIGSHVRALDHFGGVPAAIVPDNLKSGVKKPWYYDPEINPTYREFAVHYGTAILPARVGSPRGKAKVEVGVQVVQRWILARLRHRRFFSLGELNEAIAELLIRLNARPFRKLPGCRQSLFETLERPALKPMPSERYEFCLWKKATVGIDYHVEYDRHYYSVPYEHARQKVEIRATAGAIEVFLGGRRVATHTRSYVQGGHTTVEAHRPKHHRRDGWDPDRLIAWGAQAGPSVGAVIAGILAMRQYPEQGYRSALGVIRMGKRVGNGRLEAACGRALAMGSPRYSTVRRILERGLEGQAQEDTPAISVQHENIRGADYYQMTFADSEEASDNAAPAHH